MSSELAAKARTWLNTPQTSACGGPEESLQILLKFVRTLPQIQSALALLLDLEARRD